MAQIIRHRRGSLESLSAATASFQKGELIIVSGSSNLTTTNGAGMVFAATESGSVQAVNRFLVGNDAPNVFSSSTYNGLVKGVPYYASGSSTLYLLGSDGNDIPDLTGNITNFSASVATSLNSLSSSIGGGNIGISVAALNSKSGSYATTGSNTFEGLQHINGAIEIHSGSNPEIRLQNTTTGIEYHIQNGDAGNFQIHNGTTGKLLFRFDSGSIADGNQDAAFFGGLYVSESLLSHTITGVHITASAGFSGSVDGIGNVTAFSSSVDSRFSASAANVTSLSASVASVTGDFSSSVAQTFTTQSQRISSLESFSGSQLTQNSDLATITGSLISSASTAKTTNDTQDGRLTNLETTSASVNISIANINSFSSSQLTQNSALATITGSLISTASLHESRINQLASLSGSYATTGSNVFYGTQVFTGSLYVAYDLIVQGSSSIQYITASQVDLGTNTIVLRNDSPAVRFGGISVVDSGSAQGASGSLFWDSLNNNWIYQHPSGGAESGMTAVLISGPLNSGSMGSEAHITTGKIMVAHGDDHIGDSIATQASDNSKITISGSLGVSGSIVVNSGIAGTGSIFLQPDITDGRKLEIYNTGASDTHIKASGGLTFLGDDTNYVVINDSAQTVNVTGVNGVIINNSLDVTGSLRVKDSAATFAIVGNGFSETYLQSNGGMLLQAGGGGVQIKSNSLAVDNNLTVGGDISGSTINGLGNATAFSQSVSASIAALSSSVGSGAGVSISNLNAFTESFSSSYISASSSFDTRISNVSSSLYDLSGSTYNLSGSTYSASSSFDTRISNASSSLYDLSGSTYSISSSLDTRVSNVSSSVYDLSGSVYSISSSFDTRITNNSSSISTLSGSAYTLSSSFDTRITNNSSSISDLSGSTYNLSSSLDTRITNASSSISDLSGSTYNLSSSLDTRITNNSSSISDLSGSVYSLSSSLDTRITNNSSSISDLSGSTYNLSSSLDTRIANNSSSISTLSGSTYELSSSLDTRITNNSSSISDLSGSTYSLSSSLDTRITNNSSSISDLSGSVYSLSSSLDTRITNVSSSVYDLSGSTYNLSSSLDTRITNNSSSISDLSGSTYNFSSSVSASITALSASIGGGNIGNSVTLLNSKTGSYATTGSNVFVGDQTITGSLAINDSATNFLIEGNGFGQTYLTAGGAIVLNPGFGGVEMVGSYRTFKATDITAEGTLSASVITGIGNVTQFSTSVDSRLSNLQSTTASLNTSVSNLNTATASLKTSVIELNSYSSSLKQAFALTGADVEILGDLTVRGTTTSVTSTTIQLGDNIIELNGTGVANGGLLVKDNTSPNTLSGSLLWDSANDYWKAGAAGAESKVLLANGDNVVSGGAQIPIADLDGYADYNDNILLEFSASNASITSLSASVASVTGDFSSSVATSFSASNASITSLSASVASVTGDFSSSVATSFSASTASQTLLSSSVATSFSASVASQTLLSSSFASSQTAQNDRLGLLEISTGSLNSFTSSIDTTIKTKLNVEGVVSGSSQIDIASTTGYSTFSSSIATSISASVAGATWENLVGKPEGIVSGSVQVDITQTTGFSTFSASIETRISIIDGGTY